MVERWLSMGSVGTGEGLVRSFQVEVSEATLRPGVHRPDAQPSEQFLADIWVYITLALMVVSCVGCVCSCLLYHKFQQWKHHELGSSLSSGCESGRDGDEESLPSYTLVTGLPSYEQAVEQMKQGRGMTPLSVPHLLSAFPADKS